MVVNCIKIANKILEQASNEILVLKEKYHIKPKIIIIRLNNDLASEKYVNIKAKKGQELGVDVEIINNIKTQKELIDYLNVINDDPNINGYLVQLPLPSQFDKEEIFEHISINKDLDGLSSLATTRNFTNSTNFYPKACTSAGIMQIIANCNYDLSGKNVVIINRSLIVGKPLITMMLEKDATVTICHSKTKNLKAITKQADVIVTAIGKPNFIDDSYINDGTFIIDAGISVVNNKVVGDCDINKLQDKNITITPVPNGVGKLTVAMIFANLVELIKQQIKESHNERI